ncbi:MAG: MotA/TolQ/ExbB proton channel family protein, partial [Deltaproteobacteria bacterium]|nr:MotA/TolQ/ExbB proton channel family protein [Deltaproteobacteria bacterium]
MSWNKIAQRKVRFIRCSLFVAMSVLFASVLFISAQAVHAAEDRVSLDELLRQVKQGSARDQKENAAREREFLSEKRKQESLLAQARKTRQNEERRSERLEARFRDGEDELARTQELLRNRLGDLGELFGVVRQVAGDTIGTVDGSLVSAQFPGRGESLTSTAKSKELRSIEQLEHLWFVIQQEMTESGRVVRFSGNLIDAGGQSVQREVIRVGSFTATSDGKFLDYNPVTKRLVELPSQPAGRHTSAIKDLQKATSGIVGASVDPARGAILGLLIQKPDLLERIQQGRIVGKIIITAGLACLVLSLFVMIRLMKTGAAIKKELGRSQPDVSNPLGRVLSVYFKNPTVDVETLELKLDEAIVKEVPGIERWIFVLRLGAVLAPLLGLLGTVTGMIETFQSIMLFGTGDPKVMAGGISSALVTTVLGLTVAIPLTL